MMLMHDMVQALMKNGITWKLDSADGFTSGIFTKDGASLMILASDKFLYQQMTKRRRTYIEQELLGSLRRIYLMRRAYTELTRNGFLN